MLLENSVSILQCLRFHMYDIDLTAASLRQQSSAVVCENRCQHKATYCRCRRIV